MKFLILNGPNLNMLGVREPGIYGTVDYEGMVNFVKEGCAAIGVETEFYQSNHEGSLVDAIQSALGLYDGIVINPGAYTHTSIAILDALKAVALPAAEVHISDVTKREPFRQTDVVSFGCQGHFIGEGPQGYLHACLYLAQLLRADGTGKAHIVM